MLKRFSYIVIEYATILVIASIIIGIIFDELIINYLFPIIPVFVLGMMVSAGLMIRFEQLKNIQHKQLLTLTSAQYLISTIIGFLIASLFFNIITDEPDLALGQVLHGSMPSEQTTPVWIKLANGNLVFGIIMLITSTLVSPFLSPTLTFLFAGSWVEIDYVSMFIALIITVLLPILIGSIIRTKISVIEKYDHIYTATSTLSALPTVMIVGALAFTFMLESLELLPIVIIASLIHFSSTVLLGLIIPKVLRWSDKDIPVFVYNLSMKEFAVTLGVIASMGLSNEVGIPASVYGMMHMASAPLIAKFLKKRIREYN
ncbi:MAG: sodium transporter [Candidatus Nitrosocaldaceae archaeon]|nr:MAG: sodium transporter [Candidatus Nitrosocaldaceae archaeon]